MRSDSVSIACVSYMRDVQYPPSFGRIYFGVNIGFDSAKLWCQVSGPTHEEGQRECNISPRSFKCLSVPH
jgi:hypothetical protein